MVTAARLLIELLREGEHLISCAVEFHRLPRFRLVEGIDAGAFLRHGKALFQLL